MKNFVVLLVVVCVVDAAVTIPPATNSIKKEDKTEVSTINWSFYNIAALTTAVIVVSAGVGAVISLVFPLFAYKICYLLGGCQQTLADYVDQIMGIDGSHKINKRSIEYLEPILTTLANAYEKYADTDITPVAMNIFRLVLMVIHVLSQLFTLFKTFFSLLSVWYG